MNGGQVRWPASEVVRQADHRDRVAVGEGRVGDDGGVVVVAE